MRVLKFEIISSVWWSFC